MKIVISTSIDKPLHAQIADCVRAEVLNGKLKGGDPLPSIRQLAAELGVSVITVKNAYETLQGEGFIYSFPSKGFYVSELSDKQIDKIKKTILENTVKAQMDYLKGLGLSEDDVIALLKEKGKNKD